MKCTGACWGLVKARLAVSPCAAHEQLASEAGAWGTALTTVAGPGPYGTASLDISGLVVGANYQLFTGGGTLGHGPCDGPSAYSQMGLSINDAGERPQTIDIVATDI